MRTTTTHVGDLAAVLDEIRHTPLDRIPELVVADVVDRVVPDREDEAPLEVAAFSSAV